jgi:hypothetical protein
VFTVSQECVAGFQVSDVGSDDPFPQMVSVAVYQVVESDYVFGEQLAKG